MWKPWRARVLRTLTVTVGLTVSGLALVALIRVSDTRVTPERLAPEPVTAATASAALLRQPDLVAAPASSTPKPPTLTNAPSTARTDEPKPEPSEPKGIEVPDFKGKRLSQVMRKAKELGLRVLARDEYGNRITAQDAVYYRVQKQLTAAGSELLPKGQIAVRVREMVEYAAGY